MPKYKDLVAEFEYAYARHVKTEKALEFSWIIRRAHTHDSTAPSRELIARLRPSGYGIQNDGSRFYLRMGLSVHWHPYESDEAQIGNVGAGEIMKIAKLKEQIERWELGTRDDLPSQAELDEL